MRRGGEGWKDRDYETGREAVVKVQLIKRLVSDSAPYVELLSSNVVW